ncbi:MAG: WD40/YVTN/BNR-like repeat-containing protein, partial [Candidatus Nanopelagicales bacterium]
MDFTIAGETGDFNEFLVGGNRTWKVVLSQIGANDITDWQAATPTQGFRGMAFGNGLFVGASSTIAYSSDGITWTSAGSFFPLEYVAFGNGLFVAVGYATVGVTPTSFIRTSPDGINWTVRTPSEAMWFQAISYGNGLFVAVARFGTNRIMTSPDGITWTSRTTSINPTFTGVAYGNGIWVAVSLGSPGGTTFTSYDGINWDEQATVFGANTIHFAAGKFTIGNYYSVDGLTWISNSIAFSPQSITYGNGYFVGVNDSGTNRIVYSTNAINWTAIPAASVATFECIAFGNNTFVMGATTGTSRINYLQFDGLQPFFTGYIAPDFITSPYSSGNKLFEFTAIDGLKGLDSIRSDFATWPDPRTEALSAIVGALNQSFVDKRNTFVGVNIHETRMDDTISPFRQFNVPLNAIYTDGETAKFTNGVRIENEQLYLKETIERMVNPFLARVFLWKDTFYVIRLNEYNQLTYQAFTFDPNQSLLLSETIINGDDINADINRPEETARRVFTEFNAFLNLGVLDRDSQGGVFDAKFLSTEWNLN